MHAAYDRGSYAIDVHSPGALMEFLVSLLVFVGVHVVPMDRDVVLENQTVIVRDGAIVAIGATDLVRVPDGATVIEGKGRFLMPGLADMHVHTLLERDFVLFLANGVTTVRNLWGMPMHLQWQERARQGALDGPWFETVGPIIDGVPAVWPGSISVRDPDAARTEVRRQYELGFRMVKTYDNLTFDGWRAIVDQAHELGMRVVGHVPKSVSLREALAAGQHTIEHFTGYYHERRPLTPEEMQADVESTLLSTTWNCPTLTVIRNLGMMEDPAALEARPEMRFVAPSMRSMWSPKRDFRFQNMDETGFESLRQRFGNMLLLTRRLHERGGRLLLGTDTPNPFVVPGFSIHDELALFVEAGLTPYEALRTGTVNAAEALDQPGAFGVVRVGARADLLLLEKNPLEDVAHVKRPLGVCVRGRWFDRETLDGRLEALATK